MARALHTLLLGPEYFQFSLNALVYRQIHNPTFAGAVDRDREPIKMLFQNLNIHLDAELATMWCSIAMSHVALGLSDLSPIQCSVHIDRKGRDQSHREIGHNGVQILIRWTVASDKRCSWVPRALLKAQGATSKQLPVSLPRRPFGSHEMTIEGTTRSIGLLLRVYVQDDP